MGFERARRGVAWMAVALLVGTGAAEAKKKNAVPPPPFWTVDVGELPIYLVPGISQDDTGLDALGVLFTCINLSITETVSVRVELWDSQPLLDAGPFADDTLVLEPGETQMWETQPIPSIEATNMNAGNFGKGVARIVQVGPSSIPVICSAERWLAPGTSDLSEAAVGEMRIIPLVEEITISGKRKRKRK